METTIIYFGQSMKVACDEKCNKAWGINTRPKVAFDQNDEDDFAWLPDQELGEAPDDTGIYEGGQGKPISPAQIPNKWCVRECERCTRSDLGEVDVKLVLPDFSKLRHNQPWKHEE